MKIVSVLTSDARGGAEFAAHWILDAMAERGHHTVHITDQSPLTPDAPTRSASISLGPRLSARTYPRLALTWPLLARRLRTALRRESPYDVLMVHFKKEQLLATTLPATLRPKLVWAEWGPVPFPMRQGLAGKAYAAAGRRADLVVAVSTGTRNSVCETGIPGEKVVVLPNAVRTDEIRFRPEARARLRAELGIPEHAFVVGCVSRFHPKKRNDVVVEAVKLLGADVHLVLAGEGECERDLRARAASLEGRAHFLPTPGNQIADVLSSFDVSVFCPSPTEGMPLAVVLSMLTERPVIATAPEGVEELLDKSVGGVTSPANDPRSLATLIGERVIDPAGSREAGRRARERARARFDAPLVAERFEQLIAAAGAGAGAIDRVPPPAGSPTRRCRGER